MTHVVTARCVDCRYTYCVVECPVSCFYEVKDPHMLVIDPGTCIDCEACVPEFDELVRTSDAILDRDAYLAAMAQMVKALADSAWIIPIHAKSTPTLARADLTGFKPYRHRVEMDARKLHWTE